MIYIKIVLRKGIIFCVTVKGSKPKNSVLLVLFCFVFGENGIDFVGRKIRETYKCEIARYLAIIR